MLKRAWPYLAVVAGVLCIIWAAVALASEAAADTTDDAFLAALEQEGISGTSDAALIESGHAVCRAIDAAEVQFPDAEGKDIFLSLVEYVSDESELGLEDSAYFVGVSIGAYCRDNTYIVDDRKQYT